MASIFAHYHAVRFPDGSEGFTNKDYLRGLQGTRGMWASPINVSGMWASPINVTGLGQIPAALPPAASLAGSIGKLALSTVLVGSFGLIGVQSAGRRAGMGASATGYAAGVAVGLMASRALSLL